MIINQWIQRYHIRTVFSDKPIWTWTWGDCGYRGDWMQATPLYAPNLQLWSHKWENPITHGDLMLRKILKLTSVSRSHQSQHAWFDASISWLHKKEPLRLLWRISHMLDTVKWDQHRPTAHKKLRLRQNTQNSSPASCIWDLPVAIQESHGKMAHGQVTCLVWEVHTDCSIWNSLKVTWVTSAYERLFYCCFSELAQHNGFTPWYPEECFTGLKAAQSRLSLHHPFAALLGVGSTPRHSRRTGPNGERQ